MIALVFVVAALLLIIAAVLLVLDGRRKRADELSTATAAAAPTDFADDSPAAVSQGADFPGAADLESTDDEPDTVAPSVDAVVPTTDAVEPTAGDCNGEALSEEALPEKTPKEGVLPDSESSQVETSDTETDNDANEPVTSEAAETVPADGVNEAGANTKDTKEKGDPKANPEDNPKDSDPKDKNTEDRETDDGNRLSSADESDGGLTGGYAIDSDVQASGETPIAAATAMSQTAEPRPNLDSELQSAPQSAAQSTTQQMHSSTSIVAVEIPDGTRSHRRQRKAWAKQRNADYLRIDRNLQSNWRFTPDGDAKAVVSGFAYGRQSYVFDAGNHTIVALRRSIASEERLELSRNNVSELQKVAVEAGLLVSATTPQLIHRIFDDRANQLLIEVPTYVERMWSESNWALAQLPRSTGAEHWEKALQTLNNFSNIVKRLPPAEGEVANLDESGWDPTRPQLVSHDVTADDAASRRRGHLQAVTDREEDQAAEPTVEPLDVDVVDAEVKDEGSPSSISITAISANRGDDTEAENWRPKRDGTLDSMNLPSRSVPRKMGENNIAAQSQLQAQESTKARSTIPALGEDPEHSQMKVTGGGIIRHNEKPASIFIDAADDSASSDASGSSDAIDNREDPSPAVHKPSDTDTEQN